MEMKQIGKGESTKGKTMGRERRAKVAGSAVSGGDERRGSSVLLIRLTSILLRYWNHFPPQWFGKNQEPGSEGPLSFRGLFY
uniref:Uncharacterized protein n=1 Tax=Nelumbo nucifera TaxID=4432 RepID=A0A822XP05_NELNU|nr:TPA_asm: hypothetical protein HUJ06_022394 [Nelumbo nucifera]